LIHNILIVLGVQQSEAAKHVHISTLFLKIIFTYMPLQNIE